MKTIKVIKTGPTAAETRKQLRKGTNKLVIKSRPNVSPELEDMVNRIKSEYTEKLTAPDIAEAFGFFDEQAVMMMKLLGFTNKKNDVEPGVDDVL